MSKCDYCLKVLPCECFLKIAAILPDEPIEWLVHLVDYMVENNINPLAVNRTIDRLIELCPSIDGLRIEFSRHYTGDSFVINIYTEADYEQFRPELDAFDEWRMENYLPEYQDIIVLPRFCSWKNERHLTLKDAQF